MLPRQNDLDIVFVGSRGYHSEWPYRPQLVDWLKQTYGSRFHHFSGEVESEGLKRGLELNQVYADAKVGVGDTLCINFDYPYYFSDRLFENTGRGGFTISPYIKGIAKCFSPGKQIITFTSGNSHSLHRLLVYYIPRNH